MLVSYRRPAVGANARTKCFHWSATRFWRPNEPDVWIHRTLSVIMTLYETIRKTFNLTNFLQKPVFSVPLLFFEIEAISCRGLDIIFVTCG